ncbi:DNA-binding response regulator [Mucilaginibacter sp. PAMC 26640]|nr:DNA-binding response regulator [Mucilaginibacter sp. PAMC 26640]
MLTVLIIEDELPNIQRLEKMLHALDRNISIAAKLQTVAASVEWLRSNQQPDIIFMDIRLTDGLSFEIFTHVDVTAPVIFITAYDEYALKAFEVNGIAYLLKPLEAEKLQACLTKTKSLAGLGHDETILKMVKNMHARQPIYRTRFLIAYRDKFILVMADEIAYFTSENKTTFLVRHNAQRFMIDQTLEILEKEMNPDGFFRISRQYIVSIKAILNIHQSFNGQLKIDLAPSLNEGVLISREKSNQLKNWLNQSGL